MINIDQEFYSSPYYFLLREKGDKCTLYFSVENTLSEARKKDDIIQFEKKKSDKVKNRLRKILKDKTHKTTASVKQDIEELVNTDGSMSNSKIPILDPRLHPKKTMDQTVAAATITNDPITRGYRTYYGESIDEEKNVDMMGKKCEKCKKGKYKETSQLDDLEGVLHCSKCGDKVERYKKKIKEIDMSGAFGYDETKDMDGKETYEFYVKELGMEPDEAKERTIQQGKDPSGKKDKKSEFKNDPNFISRMTISEIQKQKAIKMVEDMLAKKQDSSSADITKKEDKKSSEELPATLKRNVKSLIKQAEKNGLTKKELIKLIQSE
jgi:hypothetical protein